MRAIVPNDGIESLVALAEVPVPVPADDEALIEVEAFSINRGETFLLERPRPGWRPGKDVAGRVVRAAQDGSGPPLGTPVVGHPAQSGWAELAAVPTSLLARRPDGVDAVTAAALPLAGLTALRLLRISGPLPGTRILLTGASGGVGHFVTELASAVGAEITAVSATPERSQRLLALGAAHIVTDVGNADGPFDLVLESVGGASLPAALARLHRGGRLVWFGQASRTPVTLDFFDYFAQTGATIRHFHYEDSPVPVSADLASLLRLVANDRLHPELGVVADWSRTGAALEQMRARQLRGNAVLRIPPSTEPERTHHGPIE